MNDAVLDISGEMQRVIGAQLVVGAILGVGFLVVAGPLQGGSALYGGLIGLLLTLLRGRSFRRANRIAETDPRRSMTTLYIGAAQRFFFVMAALMFGLALLELTPLAVAAGFAAVQLAQLINARGSQDAGQNTAQHSKEGPTS